MRISRPALPHTLAASRYDSPPTLQTRSASTIRSTILVSARSAQPTLPCSDEPRAGRGNTRSSAPGRGSARAAEAADVCCAASRACTQYIPFRHDMQPDVPFEVHPSSSQWASAHLQPAVLLARLHPLHQQPPRRPLQHLPRVVPHPLRVPCTPERNQRSRAHGPTYLSQRTVHPAVHHKPAHHISYPRSLAYLLLTYESAWRYKWLPVLVVGDAAYNMGENVSTVRPCS